MPPAGGVAALPFWPPVVQGGDGGAVPDERLHRRGQRGVKQVPDEGPPLVVYRQRLKTARAPVALMACCG
jgi:hypothetical protein